MQRMRGIWDVDSSRQQWESSAKFGKDTVWSEGNVSVLDAALWPPEEYAFAITSAEVLVSRLPASMISRLQRSQMDDPNSPSSEVAPSPPESDEAQPPGAVPPEVLLPSVREKLKLALKAVLPSVLELELIRRDLLNESTQELLSKGDDGGDGKNKYAKVASVAGTNRGCLRRDLLPV